MQISYRKAIAWIAENDEPMEQDWETISDMISVQFLADMIDKSDKKIAADIIKYRLKHGIYKD